MDRDYYFTDTELLEQFTVFDEAYGTRDENKQELVNIASALIKIVNERSNVKTLKYRKSIFRDRKFIKGTSNQFAIVISTNKDDGKSALSFLLAYIAASIIGFGFYSMDRTESTVAIKYISNNKGSIENELSKKFGKTIKITKIDTTFMTERYAITIKVDDKKGRG